MQGTKAICRGSCPASADYILLASIARTVLLQDGDSREDSRQGSLSLSLSLSLSSEREGGGEADGAMMARNSVVDSRGELPGNQTRIIR